MDKFLDPDVLVETINVVQVTEENPKSLKELFKIKTKHLRDDQVEELQSLMVKDQF